MHTPRPALIQRHPTGLTLRFNPERRALMAQVQAAISARRGQRTPMTKCIDLALAEWLAMQPNQSN